MTRTSHLTIRVTSLSAVLVLGFSPLVGRAQEFSADVVYLSGAARPGAPATASAGLPHQPSKLYVSKDQLRLETRGLTDTILLVDRAEHSAFVLLPKQKAFQPLTSGPAEYFRVESADDACPDWQKTATQKLACEKVGPEVVAGRQTVKYQSKGAPGSATAAVWIDPALKFVVKWESAGASAELRDIKEAAQASDLFTVPSGYEPLTPQKMKSKGFPTKPR